MTVTELTTAVSSVGFPIVMSFVLCFYVREITNNQNNLLMDLKQTIAILTEAVKELDKHKED